MDIREKISLLQRLKWGECAHVQTCSATPYDFYEIGCNTHYPEKDMLYFIQSMIRQHQPLIYGIQGGCQYNDISLYIGTRGISPQLQYKLISYFPNIKIHKVQHLKNEHHWNCQLLITGIPNILIAPGNMDIFFRAMQGREFLFNIIATPLSRNIATKIKHCLFAEKTCLSELMEVERTVDISQSGGPTYQYQITKDDISFYIGNIQSTTGSLGVNYILKDAGVEYYYNLLSIYIDRMKLAQSSGLWETIICISAERKEDLYIASDIWTSLYSNAAVEPFCIYAISKPCNPLDILQTVTYYKGYKDHILYAERTAHATLLTGEEIATLFALPIC